MKKYKISQFIERVKKRELTKKDKTILLVGFGAITAAIGIKYGFDLGRGVGWNEYDEAISNDMPELAKVFGEVGSLARLAWLDDYMPGFKNQFHVCYENFKDLPDGMKKYVVQYFFADPDVKEFIDNVRVNGFAEAWGLKNGD